jgi:hypothetical protein
LVAGDESSSEAVEFGSQVRRLEHFDSRCEVSNGRVGRREGDLRTQPAVVVGGGSVDKDSVLSELSVHTWGLATATGQQPDWDDTVVTAALAAREFLPAENRRTLFEEISAEMDLDDVAIPFAEAVPVPDNAPAIERLVAWNGRDPSG